MAAASKYIFRYWISIGSVSENDCYTTVVTIRLESDIGSLSEVSDYYQKIYQKQ